MLTLLIDDHVLFREAIGLLIRARLPGLELLEASDLAAGMVVLREQPDVGLILVDLNLPDVQGPVLIEQLRRQAPGARMIVLSADDRPETVARCLQAGASGFVPKTAQGDTLAQALQQVLALEHMAAADPPVASMPSGVRARGFQPVTEPPGSAEFKPTIQGLSPRQRDVLSLLLQGRSNKMICRELGLSESTVKTHLEVIFRRLGVNSRTQAVMAAARLFGSKGG